MKRAGPLNGDSAGGKNRGAKKGRRKKKRIGRKEKREERKEKKEGRKKRREEERRSKEFDVDRTIKPEPIDLKF